MLGKEGALVNKMALATTGQRAGLARATPYSIYCPH